MRARQPAVLRQYRVERDGLSSPASTTTRPSTTSVLTRRGAQSSSAETASPAPL